MSNKILEGIFAAEEGATVYRKADGQKMMVTGVAVSFIDKYGNRKEEVVRFIELASQAKVAKKLKDNVINGGSL